MAEHLWPVAMEAHERSIFCDLCHEPAPVLYREWEVFDLHRMFCASCMASLKEPTIATRLGTPDAH